MNRNFITPERKQDTPRQRLRPLGSPANPRRKGKQVEGNVEEADPKPRSITGDPVLSDTSTSTRPDQAEVTVEPESPLALEKGDPETDEEPSMPNIPTATEFTDTNSCEQKVKLM